MAWRPVRLSIHHFRSFPVDHTAMSVHISYCRFVFYVCHEYFCLTSETSSCYGFNFFFCVHLVSYQMFYLFHRWHVPRNSKIFDHWHNGLAHILLWNTLFILLYTQQLRCRTYDIQYHPQHTFKNYTFNVTRTTLNINRPHASTHVYICSMRRFWNTISKKLRFHIY